MPPYSKSRVNRAGKVFADRLSVAMELSGRRLEPEVRNEIQEAVGIIDWWREQHSAPLSRVAANLGSYVAGESKPVVAQRLKRVPTIAGKLVREPHMKLSQMADIGGVRAILPNQEAAYRIAAHLEETESITKMRDYVANPKRDGYRALHLINRIDGHLIEIQLRTPLQDAWANLVETMSRTAFPGLKFGQGPSEVREFLLEHARLGAKADQGLQLSDDELTRYSELVAHMDNLIDQKHES